MKSKKLISNFSDKGLKVKRDKNYGRIQEPKLGKKPSGKIMLGNAAGNGSMRLMGK